MHPNLSAPQPRPPSQLWRRGAPNRYRPLAEAHQISRSPAQYRSCSCRATFRADMIRQRSAPSLSHAPWYFNRRDLRYSAPREPRRMPTYARQMFDLYLSKWRLIPDGEPIVTHAARLLPVLRHGEPAMLKLSLEEDERFGGAVMEWWSGHGAARVLAREEHALLLERATGSASLSDMARTGQDDEACRILCGTAARLHAPRARPLPDLTPLAQWFRELEPAARTHGGVLLHCAETAKALLRDQREIVVLHGDLHHDNVLDFGERGWLAIDPKHIIGERGFDFANIFTNPDLADPDTARSNGAGSLCKASGYCRGSREAGSASAAFSGSLPGPVCPRRGSWETVTRWRRST